VPEIGDPQRSSYGYVVTDLGVRVLRTPVRAPHGKLHMRTVRWDTTSRVLGLPNSAQRTHLKMTIKEWGLHNNQGRPHSSLGPGILEPKQDRLPASNQRHKLPAGYCVVKTSVLHEYRLAKEAA
jgi:putative transposase